MAIMDTIFTMIVRYQLTYFLFYVFVDMLKGREIYGRHRSPTKQSPWWGPPRILVGAPTSSADISSIGDWPGPGYACPGTAFGTWLNSTSVRAALHVAEDSFFFNGDNGVGFVYNLTEKNVLPFYKYCNQVALYCWLELH